MTFLRIIFIVTLSLGINFVAHSEILESLNSKIGLHNSSYNRGDLGVGLQVGSLSGLNLSYWITDYRAITGSLAINYKNTVYSISHLWTLKGAFDHNQSDRVANYFLPYLGVGGLVAVGSHSDYFNNSNENFVLAARVPIGIEFIPGYEKFSIFAELAPSLKLGPYGYGFLTADIGAKFYF